jgi:hypothetical protein
MGANDEHDPLDDWLHQQVRPLPPPPGTFELITRRARGRKLRRLAVTVVSAAAVAAAVAIAVPVGLNLHLNTPSTSGGLSAEGSSTTPGKESPNGENATRIKPTPTPTPTPSPTQPTITAPGGVVPANFQPSSVTFVNANEGWVIGQAGTPGTCENSNPDICTSIAWTDNGGQSWQGEHAPDTTGPSGPTGVSGVRFLSGSDGWAFGPELWATVDRGETWTQVDTNGARVTDLEASAGQAYALFASCSTQTPDFAQDCTSYTLMTATAGSNNWTPVSGVTSGLTKGGAATSAVLALTGTNGYLLAPDGTLYSGPIGGTWSRVSTAPCQPGSAQADGLPAAAQLALQGPTELAIACDSTPSAAVPSVYTSDDGGALWTQEPAAVWSDVSLGDFGVVTSLAATPSGTLTLATTNGIYYLAADGSRWQASSATGSKGPSGGFSYVGMTTYEQGVALPADTSLHEIWMTFDGGQTWSAVTSITPGR